MMESTLSLRVDDGSIIVLSYNGWMTRPQIMIMMLQMYIKDRGYKNLPQINIDLSDTCSDAENNPEILYFTISAKQNSICNLVPDPYSFCWPEANIENVFKNFQKVFLIKD